jgi:hypothetical protein
MMKVITFGMVMWSIENFTGKGKENKEQQQKSAETKKRRE